MKQNPLPQDQMSPDPHETTQAKPQEPPAMTAEQARELLATEQKNRVEQCGAALREVLQANGCQLQSKVTIIGDRVTAEVLIVPVA